MNQLSGILLHVDLMNADFLFACCGVDLYPAVVADWQIQLGNLVVLRVIRIEVVFPVKFTVLVDAAVGGKSYRQRIFYHLLVQDRKGTRHTGADRAGVGIRCSAKLGGTAAENFGFGGQFYVNLQTNDGLILFAHVTVPPFLPVLPVPALRRFCCTRKHSLRG